MEQLRQNEQPTQRTVGQSDRMRCERPVSVAKKVTSHTVDLLMQPASLVREARERFLPEVQLLMMLYKTLLRNGNKTATFKDWVETLALNLCNQKAHIQPSDGSLGSSLGRCVCGCTPSPWEREKGAFSTSGKSPRSKMRPFQALGRKCALFPLLREGCGHIRPRPREDPNTPFTMLLV